jgi:hypothetical protein
VTTIFSWTSVDSRGPSALYIASDSRISWITATGHSTGRWDIGRKLFASRISADVFGFSGDVLFPSILLGQICSLIDASVLFSASDGPLQRAEVLRVLLARGLDAYPEEQRRDFSVFYGTRTGERPIPYRAGDVQPVINVHLFIIRWSAAGGWTLSEGPQPISSGVTAADGSGQDSLTEHVRRWAISDVGGTSRAVFGAFCDSLKSGRDLNSGGAPQLVRIGPAGPAESIGIIWEDALYLFGQQISTVAADLVEWRNSHFEACDPHTRHRRENAQRQPRPGSV